MGNPVLHANAPLSIEGRRRLVERCRTRPIAHVAAEMGISRACASKWVNRYRRRGELGTATNEYGQPGMNCGAVSPAVDVAEQAVRRARRVRPQPWRHVDGQDQAPVREAGQRQASQRRSQPVGVGPALVEAVVSRTVSMAVFGQERQLDSRARRAHTAPRPPARTELITSSVRHASIGTGAVDEFGWR